MVVLESERLILRDYLENDLDDFHRLISDRQNMYFLDDMVTNSWSETVQSLRYSMANTDGHYFCVRRKEDDKYVGSSGYTITVKTPIGNIASMWYFILPEHHKLGYATEALKKTLEFAFKDDGLIRITSGCYKDNAPCVRVMEKVGFRKEGERINAVWHDGKMKDRYEYAINKDEYFLSLTLAKN